MTPKRPCVLVTGAAGFIGFHVARRLLADQLVVGLDNMNPYYDVNLKEARVKELQQSSDVVFVRRDLCDRDGLQELFKTHMPKRVVHLAAQAGVRYSLENPYAYEESNLSGFLNILECCRHFQVEHLVYASSSSVYGSNTHFPFSVSDNVDHPVSLYAATKKANELMAHAYSHLFKIPVTGLRFFSVYGPWGRPDMALFLFTKSILEDRPIDVYNFGNMKRDFTYIDDIVEGVVRVLDQPASPDPSWNPATPDPSTSNAPYRLYNIGNNAPVPLLRYIELIEDAIGKKATLNLLPLQPGDVPESCADIEDLAQAIHFRPQIPVEIGISRFVAWYREFYRV